MKVYGPRFCRLHLSSTLEKNNEYLQNFEIHVQQLEQGGIQQKRGLWTHRVLKRGTIMWSTKRVGFWQTAFHITRQCQVEPSNNRTPFSKCCVSQRASHKKNQSPGLSCRSIHYSSQPTVIARLLVRLHLVISRHSLRISGRRCRTAFRMALRCAALAPCPVLLLLQCRRLHRLHSAVALSLVWRCCTRCLHVDVGDSVAALGILRENVVRLEIRILRYDIPGVQEAGEEP